MDNDRFMELYLRTQPLLRSFIFSLVRNTNETDDMVQEVSIDLWKCFHRYDSSRPFSAWAIGVARNHILRWRRKLGNKRLVFLPELEQMLAVDFQESEPELETRRRALETCVSRLDSDAQYLLDLRYENGLSLQEIAEKEAKTVNAINKALGKVRALLLRCTEYALIKT
jgi:RNA polymerase sigma-70 factor (ECF subfamily)